MGARFRVRGAPTGDDGAPIGIPEAVGVCALGVVLGVVAHGVKVARIVGDGVAVGVRPDAVLVVVAHGVRLLRSCGAFPSPQLEEVGACWSVCEPYTLYIYIIGENKLF